MAEQLSATPKSRLDGTILSDALSQKGVSKAHLNFHNVQEFLHIPIHWNMIKPVQTYNEFIRKEYYSKPILAENIIAASDKAFVEKYDEFAERINNVIEKSVISSEQVTAIKTILGEVYAYMRDYCERKFPSQVSDAQ